MKAILVIAVTMLMSGGIGDGFLDLELRIPQIDIATCNEAKNGINMRTHTNNPEYRDEYKFKIRAMWCVLAPQGPIRIPLSNENG